jgi:DNA-binding MarR family transcriptional regulator
MALTNAETSPRTIHPIAKEQLASTGFLLARLGFAFKGKAMATFEKAGFELYDYGVLALLAEGARQTQSTIADSLQVDPSRLVALLDSLESRQLIVRQRDAQDRRRHLVSITPDGKRELAKLRGLIKRLEEEFFAPLDAETRKALHDLLFHLATEIDPRCAFAATTPALPESPRSA